MGAVVHLHAFLQLACSSFMLLIRTWCMTLELLKLQSWSRKVRWKKRERWRKDLPTFGGENDWHRFCSSTPKDIRFAFSKNFAQKDIWGDYNCSQTTCWNNKVSITGILIKTHLWKKKKCGTEITVTLLRQLFTEWLGDVSLTARTYYISMCVSFFPSLTAFFHAKCSALAHI